MKKYLYVAVLLVVGCGRHGFDAQQDAEVCDSPLCEGIGNDPPVGLEDAGTSDASNDADGSMSPDLADASELPDGSSPGDAEVETDGAIPGDDAAIVDGSVPDPPLPVETLIGSWDLTAATLEKCEAGSRVDVEEPYTATGIATNGISIPTLETVGWDNGTTCLGCPSAYVFVSAENGVLTLERIHGPGTTTVGRKEVVTLWATSDNTFEGLHELFTSDDGDICAGTFSSPTVRGLRGQRSGGE